MNTNKLQNNRLLYQREDLRVMGITKSNTTLLRWEQLGRFPRRVRMAGTSVAWLASDIEQWFRDRAEERAHHHYADYA